MLGWTLAWRNVWRNGRRTAITVSATTFALWVMVLYSGLIEGYVANMASDVLDFEVGDVQVVAPGYLDDPSLYRTIEDTDARVAALEAAGYRVAPRLQIGALASSGEPSAGVLLRGLDLGRDGAVLRVAERVVEGEWLDPAAPREVVVGRRLARTLAVHPGSELVVLTQGADGSLANELYRVRGVLGPVGDATDRTAVFLAEGAFRELVTLPTGAHQLVVRTRPGQALDEGLADLTARLPGLEVRTWAQLLPTVASMLDAARSVITLVFFVVYLAVGILVLNAMWMAVFERVREFGVMKALGVGPWLVLRVVVYECLIVLGLSVALGLLLAAPCAVYLQTVGLDMSRLAGTSVVGLSMPAIWKGAFTVRAVAPPVVVLLLVVLVAVLWPATTAARLRPLDAMRYT
jgi:putative ABC transport system permease protein